MARTPKPYPNPITQLRTFQRTQMPSAYGENAPFRAFTVGSSNPDPRIPTRALVALNVLLRASHPIGAWMVVPPKGTQSCTDTIWDTLHAAIGTKLPMVAIGGHTTPAVFWVFSDFSCILTERTSDGLRLYPSVIYLRNRDPQWTITLLLGRGKNKQPQLRLQRATPPQGWKPEDNKHTAVFNEQDLLTTPGTDLSFGKDAAWMEWAQLLRRDVDRFYPIFQKMQGHALWPSTGSETQPPTHQPTPPTQPTPIRASVWPLTLPRRGLTPEQMAQRQNTLERAAQWLGALRHSTGASPRTLLVRPHEPNKTKRLEVVVLPTGQTPSRKGLGPQHKAYSLLIMPHAHTLKRFFPEPLAQDLVTALKGDAGLAYSIDKNGVWAHADTPTVGIAKEHMTAHEILQAFRTTGPIHEDFLKSWEVLPK